jgi:hypothetical protein
MPDQIGTWLFAARPTFSGVEFHGDDRFPVQRTKIVRSRCAAALGIDAARLLA